MDFIVDITVYFPLIVGFPVKFGFFPYRSRYQSLLVAFLTTAPEANEVRVHVFHWPQNGGCDDIEEWSALLLQAFSLSILHRMVTIRRRRKCGGH